MTGDFNFDMAKGGAIGEDASVTKKRDSAEIILRPSKRGGDNTNLDSFVCLASQRSRLWYLQRLQNQ